MFFVVFRPPWNFLVGAFKYGLRYENIHRIWYCEFHTVLSCCRSSKIKRVTRVELNRRARSKKLLRAEAEAKRVEALSKEIDWYSDMPT